MSGNSLFIVLIKFIAYFDEEISDFRLCCGGFVPQKLKIISENFEIGQPTKVKPFRCPTIHHMDEFEMCRPGE